MLAGAKALVGAVMASVSASSLMLWALRIRDWMLSLLSLALLVLSVFWYA